MATKRTSSYNHRKYLRPASEFPACGAQKALANKYYYTQKSYIAFFYSLSGYVSDCTQSYNDAVNTGTKIRKMSRWYWKFFFAGFSGSKISRSKIKSENLLEKFVVTSLSQFNEKKIERFVKFMRIYYRSITIDVYGRWNIDSYR